MKKHCIFTPGLIPSMCESPRNTVTLGNRYFQRHFHRQFSTENKPAPPRPNYLNVFDRQAKLMQRKRTAILGKADDGKDSSVYDYIKDEVGFVLADRVIDIKRDINRVLDLGCGKGHVIKHLDSSLIQSVTVTDSCEEWLDQVENPEDIECEKLLMDEENVTFKPNMFDMVTSSLSLHWVNNLPKAFSNIHRCLKPDGVFLGAMFGSQTLFELRCALQLAELEREGVRLFS